MLQLRGPAECEKPAESVGCLKWYDNLPLQQTIVSCRYNELFLFLSGNKLGESKCATHKPHVCVLSLDLNSCDLKVIHSPLMVFLYIYSDTLIK